MYITKSVAICLALFLALLEVGSCLQCYHCDSQKDPNCAKKFSSKVQPIDCSTQDSQKYNSLNLYNVLPAEVFGGVIGAPKYCHTIELETGTFVRTCLDGSKIDKDQACKTMIEESKINTPDKRVKSCKACDSDKCNGVGALSMSLPLSALTLLISYLLYKQ